MQSVKVAIPLITTQPVSQTVGVGQTATFVVAATGAAPLSYQWQKNGVNIAGATAASYTTPATTTSDSGSTFGVLVSNTAGTVTSAAATLTVNPAPVAPTITTAPANQTVTAGQTATFTVVAAGTAPLSYQWQKNGANVSGAISTSYTTPVTTTSDGGSTFAVLVSNTAGTVTSAAATLTVNPAPVTPTITTQPANQTVTAGQTATFTVVAAATAPLAYQWQKNGVNIAGATAASYTTPATTTSDSGSTFGVLVSNTAGTVTSSAATLTVNPAPAAPTITTQPTNQTVTAGQTVTFTVVAAGTAPLSYQWQNNGVSIAGATAASYTSPATTTADSGSTFTVAVSNTAGTVTSAAATLTVNPAPVAPTITAQPGNQTVTAGQTATFTVVATGTAPLSYQWRKNGVNIAGATAASYTTPATDSGASFDVVVSNTAGTVTSSAALLTVTPATLVSIAVTPANPSVAAGGTQQFTATGTFSDSSTQVLGNAVWASGTATVATINTTGLAAALKVGSTTISATSGSISGSTLLTVTPATLVSIAVTPANPSINKGATQQFTATGTFSDSSTQVLSNAVWASGTATVATINATGLATAVGVGTSTISASLGGVTSTGVTLTVTPATLVSIALTPVTPSIPLGNKQQFTATGHYSDNSTQDLTTAATWSSSVTSVATISSSGLATAVATGSTNLTATQNGITSNAAVLTVTAAVLQSISVSPTNPSIAKGLSQQFTATGHYSDNSTQDLTTAATWSSSVTSVATISSSGLATALATGSTNITATQNGITSNTAVLTVTAAVLQSISVSPTNPSIAKGLAQQFTATGTFSDNSTQVLANVTWASATPGVATIGITGLATTVGTGTSAISATSGNITGSTLLTVTPATLVSIAVTPNPAIVAVGSNLQFTATGIYSDNSTQNLTNSATWASSDSTSATITSLGLATGVKPGGPQTITATQSGVSGTASLTVNEPLLTTSALSLSFGNVSVGDIAIQTVLLTSSGDSDVTISNVIVSGPGFGAGGLPVGLALAPGETAILTVTFAPESAGSVTGSVSVRSNATNSPAAVSLSGAGSSSVDPLAAPICGLANDSTNHVPNDSDWANFIPPLVGSTYTDALYGCPVIRLTDNVGRGLGAQTVPQYSLTGTFSQNDLYLLVYGADSGGWRILDLIGNTIISESTMGGALAINGSQWRWDRASDSVIWNTSGNCTVGFLWLDRTSTEAPPTFLCSTLLQAQNRLWVTRRPARATATAHSL